MSQGLKIMIASIVVAILLGAGVFLWVWAEGTGDQAIVQFDKSDLVPNQVIPSISLGTTVATVSSTVEVTGKFIYYTMAAPPGYTETALGRLCFEPAPSETVNNGHLFCFSNREAALDGLNIDSGKGCTEYLQGSAIIQITNLTATAPEPLESDDCFSAGTCPINEAEFIKTVEIISEARCNF